MHDTTCDKFKEIFNVISSSSFAFLLFIYTFLSSSCSSQHTLGLKRLKSDFTSDCQQDSGLSSAWISARGRWGHPCRLLTALFCWQHGVEVSEVCVCFRKCLPLAREPSLHHWTVIITFPECIVYICAYIRVASLCPPACVFSVSVLIYCSITPH